MKIQFRNHWNEIFIFSILLLILLMLVRISNVLIFGDLQDIGQSLKFTDEFLFKGFRFDLKLISSILIALFWLPVILLSWLLPEKWFSNYLQLALKIILVLLVYVIFVDIGYIFYFQKPIDVLIFGLLEDDTDAIISTILANFKILLFFAAFILFTIGILRFYSSLVSRFKRPTEKLMSAKIQLFSWLISFLLLAMLARGSLDSFPLQRKHASVSDNTFLNSMVMNSVFNLYYSYRDKSVNNQAVFKQDILKLNQLGNVDQLLQKAGYDELHPLLRKTAKNTQLEKIKPHVIFVFMEGWSAQIARAHSVEKNNVLGEFAQHAAEDHFFTRFLASQYATNPAIEALLVNSPITPLSQSIANKTSFNLSNVLPFKKQNYRTLFLSGGYSSWRNHNNFWLLQGFDKYIGRSEIENSFQVDASDNPWGVYDQYVFDYLKKSLQQADQDGESLFSAVLTTNNHPPIRLPKSYVQPPLSPAAYGLKNDDQSKLSLLSGFHYQTDQLGQFISWIKNSEFRDKVIIAATGDHPQRTLLDNSSNAQKYIRYSVPTYFYVPESFDLIKEVPENVSGSHYDIFPTLIELSLSNAEYYNFGQPFMDKSVENSYGWATSGEFLFSEGIVDSRNNKLFRWLDDQQLLLNSTSELATEEQLSVINEERYRRILKKYLIVKDYKKH